MSISLHAKLSAAQILSSLESLQANPAILAADIEALAQAFPLEEDFLLAIHSTRDALVQVMAGTVDVASLAYKLDGWSAYHFQHRRMQGAPADMRIVFRVEDDKFQLLAFGHRSVPQSIYYTATNRT